MSTERLFAGGTNPAVAWDGQARSLPFGPGVLNGSTEPLQDPSNQHGIHLSRIVPKSEAVTQEIYRKGPENGRSLGRALPRFRDPYGRPIRLSFETEQPYYFGPEDAKIRPLVVQKGTTAILDRLPNDPDDSPVQTRLWAQTMLENQTPYLMRAVYWVWKPVANIMAPIDLRDMETGAISSEQVQSWEGLNRAVWLEFAGRYFIGSLAIMLICLNPRSIEGQITGFGNYDPVRYRDWGYAKSARNPQEQEGYEIPQKASSGLYQPVHSEIRGESTLSVPSQDVLVAQRQPSSDPTSFTVELDVSAPRILQSIEIERHLQPKYLCFDPDYRPYQKKQERERRQSQRRSCDTPYKKLKVTKWMSRNPGVSPSYVFISYSRKQFYSGGEKELARWDMSEDEKNLIRMQRTIDRRHLINFGLRAARRANVPAFWIDFECVDDADVNVYDHPQPAGRNDTQVLGNAENKRQQKRVDRDAYRICDAARAAHSLVIVLGPRNPEDIRDLRQTEARPAMKHSQANTEQHNKNLKECWLRQWGSRLWTLPEILLAPGGRVWIEALPWNQNKIDRMIDPLDASLSAGEADDEILDRNSEEIFKRNFAARGYATQQDQRLVGSLIDHFEGSLTLTSLEFVTTALEYLWPRSTFKYLDGDASYALMGLLRRRPEVNPFDKDFEAFARLSLANDSNQLLERLICLMPQTPGQDWHDLKDAWKGVKLWDIEPGCQIAGIVDNRTVVIDGAFGASIHWGSLSTVAFIKGKSTMRDASKFLIRLGPAWLIIAISTLESTHVDGEPTPPAVLAPSIIFLLIALTCMFLAPWALLKLYKGKFWKVQAWFFGIEGYVDLGTVEEYLFGYNHNRLKWSVNGSTLSRHFRNEYGECVAARPSLENWEKEQRRRGGTERLFTLVDTYTMTASMFWAEQPPTAVMICGREGGMQRALLCSYDWRNATFYRESVLRMKTVVLEQMSRVDRFRFALSRPRSGSQM